MAASVTVHENIPQIPTVVTYLLSFLAGGMAWFDVHAAGIVAIAALVTAAYNIYDKSKRTKFLKKDLEERVEQLEK